MNIAMGFLERKTEEEDYLETFYDVPTKQQLRGMSLVELLSLSYHSEKDSPRQRVLELEIRRATSPSKALGGVPVLNALINLIRLIRGRFVWAGTRRISAFPAV